MTALAVGVCGACGTRRFPVPLWCGACGSDRIATEPAGEGTVGETTVVLRGPGRTRAPVAVGTVRLDGGGVVVARLDGASEGDRVRVEVEDGAPVARR